MVLLLALMGSGGWYAYEVAYARPQMSYLGLPEAVDWKNPMTWTRVFRNTGFMVGYSELRGNPLWVIYALAPPSSHAPHLRRPSRFEQDWRSLTRIGHDDYDHSGYDRGHMAPNHAISLLYGREGQLDTFRMTNIVPQKPDLNRELWERMEEAEVDRLAARFSRVWVYTGPIFEGSRERLSSSFRIEIPDAFYKIYALPQADGHPRMLAFIVPQHVKGNEALSRFATTVDEVEKRTGLDFFPKLEPGLEPSVEASAEPEFWHLQEWANLPGHAGKRGDKP